MMKQDHLFTLEFDLHGQPCNLQKSNHPFTFTVHLPTVFCLFVTTVSKLKMCDFSGETFKGFEVL